ncbi:uncharacterized protein LOC110858090 isoform X2 [Folsomia candida]|uniref:uncharacterized protein LOC110858090 isoform X2 n=1 Tax=Folsomia candida TaxID=158441 RepID=UPI001604A684|nr:uncharacterized protein LOC110858090 isoform X2 [Folsomia candida]
MRSNHPAEADDDGGPSGGGEGLDGQGGSAVLIRIHVPDLNIHKCLQFYRHDLVWDVKQQCLASLPKELKESFNYGLFAPPCNGKAGKFLDEERPLSDYPFSGPVGYLELRYKRRLYKGLNLEEKQLKQIHTKSNLRRFLDYVSSAHCDKITKMCAKGLDPNFHCPETGETPLTMAALMKKPTKLLMALVNGGALLDYRTKEGCTGMHRAVEAKSYEAVKTMLDLGGSPNYKDSKGLTPLYLSVSLQADPAMTQLLLHDHAFIGAQDLQGWHEVHQACRTGLVQHLEHLLYYGADMNARNASGNTPLHVCAVNNQESSARLLLFRGADKDALNFANQTPYQMAVIAGNMELAEIIQTHRSQDVVPYRDLPSYNPRRRCVISRAFSDPRLNMSMTSLSTRSLSRVFAPHHRPPSPCPSLRSLPHFSPSSSSCPSSCSSSHGGRHTRSGSCSDSSYSSISHSAASDFSEISEHCGSATTEKSLDHSDITSDSSGVGTCNSGGSASSYEPATPTDATLILPGTMVVCVENFAPQSNLHLKLAEGDIIEVIGSAEGGTVLEGSLRGRIGLFPAQCVQEIRMKSYEKHNNHHLAPPSANHTHSSGKKGGKGVAATAATPNAQHLSRIKKVSQVMLGGPAVCDQASSFVCRWGEPHTVILHRGQKGFGFILRGAKADSPLMELTPSERFPALQYLDDVDEGGVADRAGLRKGDFILAINGMDVSQLSHEVVVDMIRKSGELVSLTVVGLSRLSAAQGEEDGSKLKPGSPAASLTHDGGAEVGGHKAAQNHFATLPRKHSGSTGPTTVPSPPRRDPTTSLSVGRARAKSMVAALADLDAASPSGVENGGVISTSADSVAGKPPLPPGATTGNGTLLSNGGGAQTKTASIRARPTSSRITAAEMQEIFADSTTGNKCGTWNGPPHKIYASVAEMKRSKSALKGKEAASTLHKDFHSTPDLKGLAQKKPTDKDQVKSLSQENLNKLVLRNSNSNPRHSWTLDRNFFPSSNLNYNDKLPEPPTESELAASRTESGDGGGGAETDGSTSDDDGQSSTESENGGGEETNKVVNSTTKGKTPVLTDGEYRTTKLIRPVQSKTLPRRASTGIKSCTISPAEQQTIINLVPPGQVIKVDVSKNKQDIYGTLEHGHSGPGQNSGGGIGGGGTLSKGQPGPGVMSSFKPTDSAKLYASPDDLRPIGYRDSGDATSPNGNNNNSSGGGGTLKKIRSQSLPPSKDASTNKKVDYAEPHNRNNNVCNGDDGGGNVNSFKRNTNTAAAGATNQNGGQGFDPQKSLQEAKEKLRPVKPVLKSSSSLQNSQTPDKIRIEVKQSPRLGRKSEKTVTFQTHPDAADLTPPDSPMAHSMSVDDIAKVKTSLKISKSFPNDLGGEEGGGGEGESGGNYVTNLPVNQPDSDSVSEDSSDKTWILKDENGGPSSTSTTSDSVQTVISAASKVLKTTATEEKISNLTAQQEQQQKKPLSASAQLGITHNFEQMQQQHQQLYGRLGDSNYGTITRGTGTGGGGGGGAVSRQPPNLTKNAVSLVKLPPPMEIESESESGRETPVGKKTVTVLVGTGPVSNQMYHTLQPQRSRSMLSQAAGGGGGGTEQPQQLQHQYHLQQQQIAARQLQQLQMQGQMQGTRQAEKSIEESLKLIQMHVAALKQDFPSVVPPPPEFGLRNQTPILAPPPEFSDARDTHEAATRFNQGHMFTAEQHQHQQQLQQQNQFNRQSPMYRSISHAHSSTSSMYSGYPTMTRQQYQQQQQLHQLQQQHAAAAAQHHQHLMQSQQQQQQAQQQATYGTLQARSAQATYGTTTSTAGGGQGAYGHYQTLTPKSNAGQISGTPPVPQTAPPSYGHHPKCYYYQQTPSATTPTTNSNSAKLHPVHRYTPDLYESSSGPRIVGTIPKKQAGSDHYEVPHAHQVMLQQQQQQQQAAAAAAASAQMQLQAQQQQQSQQQSAAAASSRVRREFRNKTLVEWTVCDACDWLDSLFMQEYKGIFSQRGIDGKKLLRMDNATLLDLGVKKLGHRMNIEKSLKRYLPQAKS